MNKKILALSIAAAFAVPLTQAEAKHAPNGIVDALLQLSLAQQVTADAVSTNTIDTGNTTPKRNMGVGEPMGCLIVITVIAGPNSGSAKLTLIQSAAAALTAPQILGEIDLVSADIAVGRTYLVAQSTGIDALRYLGLNYDITGTVDFTVSAYYGPLSMLKQRALTYSKGYTIS